MKALSTTILLFLFHLNIIIAQKLESIKLEVKVENPTDNRISFEELYIIKLGEIKLNEDGFGSSTLLVEQGVYQLNYKNQLIKIFLKTGGMLSINFDATNLIESLNFAGDGEAESRYLNKKEFYDRQDLITRPSRLPEEKYLNHLDSLKESRTSLLIEFEKNLDSVFYNWSQNLIKYQDLWNKQRYEMSHRRAIKNSDFKVSSNYPDVWKEFDLNEGQSADIFFYAYLVREYVGLKTKKFLDEYTKEEYFFEFVNQLDSLVSNNNVKSQVAFLHYNFYFSSVEKKELFLEKIRPLLQNQAQLDYINKSLTTGQASPLFDFDDINGKKVSLESLKGKPIYIDIWATYCAACIQELPHLEALIKSYGTQVNFVSISSDVNKRKWTEMLVENNLKGIQLIASDRKNSFFTNYLLSGIPRYILLDNELNIVDANAKRPSDESLRKQLDELLEK